MAHSKQNSNFEKQHGTKINNRRVFVTYLLDRKARIYGNYSIIHRLQLVVFMRVIINVVKSPAV